MPKLFLGCGRAQETRLQRARHPCGSVSRRIIAATGRMLEERPDLAKSFLKGLIRSYWFVRDMPKNYEYLWHLYKRLRLQSSDPEERQIRFSWRAPRDLEAMPFPIDGLATGFEDMLAEEEKFGEFNYDVPAIKDVCAQDLAVEAFKELKERKELERSISELMP